MKSKKVTVLLISLTLLVSMTLPGRVVVSADQAADSGEMPLLSEDEGKDISPEGAGDPDSSGANQNEAPPVPSGVDQGGDSSAPSGVNQDGDPSGSSGENQGGDPSAPSGLNQSGDPSQPEAPGSTGEQNLCTCGHKDGTHAENCPLYVPADVIPTESAKECTCGHEDGPHDETCPLYVPADVIPTEPAKECTCGNEDGTHAENCPLYEAPAEPEEEEEQAESNGASLTVSVQVSGADNGNAVLKLIGPGGYCKRIVVQGSDSVTLSGLEAGDYTVSDGKVSQSVTLEAGGSDRLDITVTRSSHGWLTGEAYQKFTFDS